jgi:hypothetical protein
MKRFFRASPLLLAVAFLLVACGGGGNSSGTGTEAAATSTRTPLATQIEDQEPTGLRVDLRADNYFPSGQGDNWTYNVIHNGFIASGDTTRAIAVVDSTHFQLTEISASTGSDSTQYTRSAGGHVLGAAYILGSSASATAQNIVGSFVEYPEPFFPVGGELKRVRQGDWGADTDGDGVNDSFRLEFRQTRVGFETLPTMLGINVETAHFHTAMSLTITPSNLAKSAVTVVATEDTWWAAGKGLMQASRELRAPNGNVTTDLLRITGGNVNGISIF